MVEKNVQNEGAAESTFCSGKCVMPYYNNEGSYVNRFPLSSNDETRKTGGPEFIPWLGLGR
jgi:hypothetical protein